MRLEIGINEYQLPKGIYEIHSVYLAIKDVLHRLQPIKLKDMQDLDPSIMGIPQYFSFTEGNKVIGFYPAPDKSYYVKIYILEEKFL